MTWTKDNADDDNQADNDDAENAHNELQHSTDECQIRQMYAKTAEENFSPNAQRASAPQGIGNADADGTASKLGLFLYCCPAQLCLCPVCCVLCFVANLELTRQLPDTERLMCNNYPKLICLFARPAKRKSRACQSTSPFAKPKLQLKLELDFLSLCLPLSLSLSLTLMLSCRKYCK